MLYDLLMTNQYHTSMTDRNRKRGLETCIALLLLTFRTEHTLPSVQSHSVTLYVLVTVTLTQIFLMLPPFRWSATVMLSGAAKVCALLLHLLRARLRISGMLSHSVDNTKPAF